MSPTAWHCPRATATSTRRSARSATALSAALVAGAHAAAGGAEAILATARAVLASVPEVEVDYLEVRGVDLGPAPERGDGRLLVAAKLGTTRLIDNVGVAVGTGFLERDADTTDARLQTNCFPAR